MFFAIFNGDLLIYVFIFISFKKTNFLFFQKIGEFAICGSAAGYLVINGSAFFGFVNHEVEIDFIVK